MTLLLEVAATVAPVFLLALVGWLWTLRGWAYDVEFVTRLSMTLSVPCLIFMALVRSDVDPRPPARHRARRARRLCRGRRRSSGRWCAGSGSTWRPTGRR